MLENSNPLYNEKTIKRLCNIVEISPTQRDATNRWLELLEKNALKKEKESYIEFAITILQKLLGYDIHIEALKPEQDYMEFPFQNSKGEYAVYFEAKGTKTKDLFKKQYRDKVGYETPVSQTWTKMSEFPIPYGVCTNYREFVLLDYSKGNNRYHIFDFFSIQANPEKLKEFVGIFSRKNIIDNNFLTQLFEESETEERTFSTEFYKLFHETRLMLIKEFMEPLIGLGKTDAVKYAQLFLNRIVFIFFAEHTGKIQSSHVLEKTILQMLENPAIDDNSTFISQSILKVFKKLNEGSTTPIPLFGFNGGLFKDVFPETNPISFQDLRPNEFFNGLYQKSKLSNGLGTQTQNLIKSFKDLVNPIIKNILQMALYDFKTEVNVNILGHIFEQSISDIEELLKDETIGKKSKKQKGKRKKEGIYYTPEYITNYICRNIILSYLSKTHKPLTSVASLILEYNDNIKELEIKVKNIKILDLACGSGAFLLKAIDILLEIKEEIISFKNDTKKYITRIKKTKKSGKITSNSTYTDLYKFQEISEIYEIIQNNIFGVDVNEESVEITKLSIFFKICRENTRLLNLTNMIKQGNSLFEEKIIAGDTAFNWDESFPEIMKNGGFDIIIGNPPYVDIKELDPKMVDELFKKYETTKNRINLYAIFMERAIKKVLKPEGFFGYIVPNSLLYNSSYTDLRKYLIDNTIINSIVKLPDNVFENVKVETVIITLQKIQNPHPPPCEVLIYYAKDAINVIDAKQCKSYRFVQQSWWKKNELFRFGLYEEQTRLILEKIAKDTTPLSEICEISLGITPYDKYKGHTQEQIKHKVFHSEIKQDDTWKPLLSGEGIIRYGVFWGKDQYLKYGNWLGAQREQRFFTQPRIIIRQIMSGNPPRIFAGYTEEELYNTQLGFNLLRNPVQPFLLKYILTILNSTLMSFYHKERFLDETKTLFQKILIENAKIFPIKSMSLDDQNIIETDVNRIIEVIKQITTKKEKFLQRIQQNFQIAKLTKMMKKFFELDYAQFFEEVKKQNPDISLKKQDELEEYFKDYQKEIADLSNSYEQLNYKIDRTIFEIYGISATEQDFITSRFKRVKINETNMNEFEEEVDQKRDLDGDLA